ncbi:hypothetical protein [Faecalibacterium sp. An192]|uniref:hypothetical protein n=1 Tax=Faecalibacterium sp. An192 TaxID=1965581 RepID=UPI000B3A74ED|nr:hypothetical protein [Faecalibacterium sp. An192]OUP26190.1 hypothetical protein B5F27_14425 [Faecalibacterium sp. An192]
MDGIQGIDTKTISLQLKSIIVFEFLKKYNELEHMIRNVFESNIPTLPSEILHQLYFYYGGKIGSYIEYEAHCVRLDCIKFEERSSFKNLSINQIIRIFKNHPCLDAFNFTITSIQHETTVFPFYDCVIRVINMRNKLAHELDDLKFKDKDIIELLSKDQIASESFELLQNFDVQRMDDETVYIASNIVFIRKMLSALEIKICGDKVK